MKSVNEVFLTSCHNSKHFLDQKKFEYFRDKISPCEMFKSGCQRKPGKMLKMSTEGGQQNKFILTS